MALHSCIYFVYASFYHARLRPPRYLCGSLHFSCVRLAIVAVAFISHTCARASLRTCARAQTIVRPLGRHNLRGYGGRRPPSAHKILHIPDNMTDFVRSHLQCLYCKKLPMCLLLSGVIPVPTLARFLYIYCN